MNIYLILFLEFFKIGLFAVGGGLATLPFLYDLTEKYDWITPELISDMIAVSESTPGPIGINTATYVGYTAGGMLGGIIASFAIVLPSLIIITIIAKAMAKFKSSPFVESAFSVIRPAVTALILVAALQVLELVIFKTTDFSSAGIAEAINIKTSVLFIILMIASLKSKFHPIAYIGIAAAAGIIFKM